MIKNNIRFMHKHSGLQSTAYKRLLGRIYRILTGVSINSVLEEYADLVGSLRVIPLPEPNLIPFNLLFTENQDTKDLGTFFNTYKSDKSLGHNYELVYGTLLSSKRNKQMRILEVGLGRDELRPNTGKKTIPGGAERAFRDWAPQAKIYGADIVRDVLFTEDRIETFWVDQTQPNTFKKLQECGPFDLVIDDGLHTPWANFNTINAFLPHLKDDGYIVVEDISKEYIRQWQLFLNFLSVDSKLVAMSSGIICIIGGARAD